MKITYYKIYCLDEDIMEVYIGSTNNLQERKWHHKGKCNSNWHLPVYMFINVNGGFDNWAFEILDEIEVEGKKRYEIEREFVKKFPLNLNSNLPSRTEKEHKKDNAEKIKKVKDKHYKNNPDLVKKWYLSRKSKNFICECGSVGKLQHKARHQRTQKHINYIELNK